MSYSSDFTKRVLNDKSNNEKNISKINSYSSDFTKKVLSGTDNNIQNSVTKENNKINLIDKVKNVVNNFSNH